MTRIAKLAAALTFGTAVLAPSLASAEELFKIVTVKDEIVVGLNDDLTGVTQQYNVKSFRTFEYFALAAALYYGLAKAVTLARSGDATGAEIIRTLREAVVASPSITVVEHATVVDLHVVGNRSQERLQVKTTSPRDQHAPATPQEFGSYLAAQIEQSRQLIKASGAVPD